MLCFTVFLFFSQIFGDEECLQSFECTDEKLTDSGTITCGGFQSCDGATFDATAIDCAGLWGCSNSNISSVDEARCYGPRGCRYSTSDENSVSGDYQTSGYDCRSVTSCSSSVLYAPYLMAEGYMTLSGSDIIATEHSSGYTYFYIRGGWSGYDATFYSNSISQVWIYFSGYGSAKDATVYCEGGSYCYIYCEYNACYDADSDYTTDIQIDGSSTYTLVCADGSTDCASVTEQSEIKIKNKNKNKNKKIITETSQNIPNPEYEYEDPSADINNKIIADTWSTTAWTICEYEGNCSSITESGFYALSCRGYESCDSSTFSSWTWYVANWGYYSGRDTTYSDGYGMTCHGYRSANGATVTDVDNIYVSGYGGLDDATITDALYVVSSTAGSLTGATINAETNDLLLNSYAENMNSVIVNVTGVGAEINFKGYWSGTNAQIYCNDGADCNVTCGYIGCSNTELYVESDVTYQLECLSSDAGHCATVTLMCDDTSSCTGTEEADNIICEGDEACEGATLVADYSIECRGDGVQQCYDTTMTADEVNCLGSSTAGEVCQYSTITAGDVQCGVNHAPTRSCLGSTVTLNQDGGELNIGSFRGMDTSTTSVTDSTGTVTINANRQGAFNDASIDCGESNTVTINGYYDYSLTLLTVTCGSGSVCIVNCYTSKACHAFNGCSGDGTCTTNYLYVELSKTSQIINFIKNNNLYFIGVIVLSIAFITSFYCCSKDKLSSRWTYEPIPDAPVINV